MSLSLHAFVLPLLGGLLIGTAATLLLAGLGRIAGISSITFDLLERHTRRTGWAWRAAFVAGLVGAGWLWQAASGQALASDRDMPWPVLVISGLLVGWGTSLGSGCTSGHGVCGLGRLSLRSLAAVLTFMGTGAMTVFVARHVVGVTH
ncbi:MAG: YeeE/YedE family protein [Aquabacterium sp.]